MGRTLSLAGLAIFFLSTIVNAAVPPLSEEDRVAMSSDIVVGDVTAIQGREVKIKRGFTNMVYHVTMTVNEVIKSDDLVPGQVVEFTYWRAHKRPDGWCGPGGQYGRVEQDSTIKAYMTKLGSDGRHLVEPNGFDKMEQD